MEITNEKQLDECVVAIGQYMMNDAIAKLGKCNFVRAKSYQQKTSRGGKLLVKATVKQLKTKQALTINIKLTDSL